MDCSLPGSSLHSIYQARILFSSSDLSNPGIKPFLLLCRQIKSNIILYFCSLIHLISIPSYLLHYLFSINPRFQLLPLLFWYFKLSLIILPRDSQESSPTPQFKSINSSALSLLHSPTLTSIHRKNHMTTSKTYNLQDLRWVFISRADITFRLMTRSC